MVREDCVYHARCSNSIKPHAGGSMRVLLHGLAVNMRLACHALLTYMYLAITYSERTNDSILSTLVRVKNMHSCGSTLHDKSPGRL